MLNTGKPYRVRWYSDPSYTTIRLFLRSTQAKRESSVEAKRRCSTRRAANRGQLSLFHKRVADGATAVCTQGRREQGGG